MQKNLKKSKNKGGRPTLPEEIRRNQKLDDVRFSASELSQLKSRALAAGVTFSAWVRQRLGL